MWTREISYSSSHALAPDIIRRVTLASTPTLYLKGYSQVEDGVISNLGIEALPHRVTRHRQKSTLAFGRLYEAVIFGNTVGSLTPCETPDYIHSRGNFFGLMFFILAIIEFFANIVSWVGFGWVSEKSIYVSQVPFSYIVDIHIIVEEAKKPQQIDQF